MDINLKKSLDFLSHKNNKSLTKQALSNSSYSLATVLVSRIGGLLFTILLARILFPDLFGLYNLALSIILATVTLADLGIVSAMTKYIAESLNKKNIKQARSRFRFFMRIKLIIALIVSVGFFLIAPLISSHFFNKPELILPLKIGAIYIFILLISGTIGAIFLPIKKLKYILFSETLVQFTRIILFLILVYFYKNIPIVFISLIISGLICGIFLFYIISKKYPELVYGDVDYNEKRKIAIFLGWSTVLSMSIVFISNIDSIMMGIFVTNSFIGYYNVIFSLVGSILALISFGSVILPLFIGISGKRLERGFNKSLTLSGIIAIPATVGLSFIIIPAIRIVYGIEYVPWEYLLPLKITAILICLLVFEEVFANMYNSLFIAKDKIKIPAITLVAITILNIVLNLILIMIVKNYGQQWILVSIALVTSLTRYLNLFILMIFAKKSFKISIKKSPLIVSLISSFVMLGFLGVFDYVFNPDIFSSLFMILLGMIIYFLSFYLLMILSKKIIKMYS